MYWTNWFKCIAWSGLDERAPAATPLTRLGTTNIIEHKSKNFDPKVDKGRNKKGHFKLNGLHKPNKKKIHNALSVLGTEFRQS